MASRSNATMGSLEVFLENEGHRVRLDLSDCGWVDPYGLVAIACLAESLAVAGRTGYTVPKWGDGARYQERMGLPSLLHEDLGLEPSRIHGIAFHDQEGALTELRRFRTWADAEPTAELVLQRLRGGAQASQAIWTFLSEACENVGDHAESSGFVAAQTYLRGKKGEYVILGVGDAGIGIRESLQRAWEEELTDETALKLVLEGGHTSSQTDKQRGRGIRSIADAVRRVDGVMMLRTNSRALRITRPEASFVKSSYLAGTVIGLQLPCG